MVQPEERVLRGQICVSEGYVSLYGDLLVSMENDLHSLRATENCVIRKSLSVSSVAMTRVVLLVIHTSTHLRSRIGTELGPTATDLFHGKSKKHLPL